MDRAIVSMFMEITSCESQAYAVQHLSSCGWNLDQAIDLYFTAGPSGVSAPLIPKEDSYYGNRGTARDAPSIWKAPSPAPVPAVPVQEVSMSQIEATGWGDEAEPEAGGGNREVEEEKAHGDAPVEYSGGEGDIGTGIEEEDGEYKEEEEEEDNVSASDYDLEDYGLEMDEDDAYYSSVVMEDEHCSDGTERGGEQPRPRPPGKNSLTELFRPPSELMYHGSFHSAKLHAAREGRFLLVNLQTEGEFASHLQNRDLWADEAVSKVVKDNFVFLLLQKRMNYNYGDEGECSKVSSFYKLKDDQLPAVLVLDPITGQLLAKRSGAIQPCEIIQFIDEYTKSTPSTMFKPRIVRETPTVPDCSTSAGASGEQEPAATESSAPADARSAQESVPVPETESPAETVDSDEPMEGEKMYTLRVRFPDGSVVRKEFGCKRRVAALFAFCRSALHDGGETKKKGFRIVSFAGRHFDEIQDDGATFEDLGLNFATVSVVFNT